MRFQNTAQAIRHGVGMVPEDRKKMGLALVNTVGFNLTLAAIRSLMRGGLINQRARRAMVSRSIRDYRIKTASPDASVASLSGGNQQKVVVAKWLASNPSLLILDEPTRGVDVGAKQEIYAIMNDLAAKGMAIVMVSSDLPEIINMSDRVVVLDRAHMGRGRSGAFLLPPKVAELVRQGVELGEADDRVFGCSNSKQQNGAIGLLTDDAIDRVGLYVPAVIFAFIPFKNAGLYP